MTLGIVSFTGPTIAVTPRLPSGVLATDLFFGFNAIALSEQQITIQAVMMDCDH